MTTFKGNWDRIVSFEETPELKEKVYQNVLAWIKKHDAYHGEVIMQDDDCIISAPDLLSDIVDELFKFEVK